MNKFYVTFGHKYRHEPHPAGGHPDGWFTVEAPDDASARAIVFDAVGPQWAFMYDSEPDRSRFPMGELKVLH